MDGCFDGLMVVGRHPAYMVCLLLNLSYVLKHGVRPTGIKIEPACEAS